MDVGRPGATEEVKTPVLLRQITSSGVYSFQSLATPGNSRSVVLKGPTVINGASCAVVGSWYSAA